MNEILPSPMMAQMLLRNNVKLVSKLNINARIDKIKASIIRFSLRESLINATIMPIKQFNTIFVNECLREQEEIFSHKIVIVLGLNRRSGYTAMCSVRCIITRL